MPVKKKITILRDGNRIVISPSTPTVKTLICPKLTYQELVILRGKERYKAIKAHQKTTYRQEWEVFSEDHKGRIATSFGFVTKIRRVLRKNGYQVVVKDLTSPRKQKQRRIRMTPDWERVADEKFRYKQKKCLKLFAKYESGRIDCFPGWGKGHVIKLAAKLFPKARIAVVTERVPIMQQRLFPDLATSLPDVGMVGGGKKIKGRRVMCYTTGSVHHATGNEDLVFVDECHEAAADNAVGKLAMFENANLWGLSGSHDMRLDNKDMRCEAMFGPIRLSVTYAEGVEHKMVVPIEIFWDNVVMDVNPCEGYSDVEKKRMGIWSNEYRNQVIARACNLYDRDVQTLVTVDTIEHALYLKQLLPHFRLVYNGSRMDGDDLKYYRKLGLIHRKFKPLTDAKRKQRTANFTDGSLRKVIATTVWNVGVNFTKLQVLARGDGGGSPINDTQIPGRTSRTNEDGKNIGIVHDFRDQFDSGCERKAKGRERSYARIGWKQHYPRVKRTRSMMRELMEEDSV